jgi:phosphoenolpyruvate carboxykinase (GTP)
VEGLGLTPDALELLLQVDSELWREEAALIGPHYEKFADRLPPGLWAELEALKARLEAAAS